MIKVAFKGTIGKKPELKGEGEKLYVQFSVATDEYVGEGKGDVRNDKQTAYKTTWLNCVAFKRTAEQIAKFSPGDIIHVEAANLAIETYEKKRDGNVIDSQATIVKVKVFEASGPYRRVTAASGASEGNGGGQQQSSYQGSRSNGNGQSQGASSKASSTITDDDIPF